MKNRVSQMDPHPAPDRLRLVQEFLNTRKIETNTERLGNPRALATWLSRWQLLSAETTLDEETWRQGLAARDVVHALVHHHSGKRLVEADVEAFHRIFGGVQPGVRLANDGSLVLVSADDGWAGALSRLLLLILEEKQSGRWRRLKICRNDACQLAFYDSSRNQTGKWCTALRCGNRINARKTRRRQIRSPHRGR